MVTYDRLQHPVLEVSIGGSVVTKRPSAFELITDQGIPSVMARLSYPVQTAVGSKGDKIVISLSLGGSRSILFTGIIYDVKVRGAYRELALTDGYKKLWDTVVTPAYRKELASVILNDILDAAGVESSAITCPPVVLARFSSASLPASSCLSLLVKALEEHGHSGLRFFFDAKNIFRFGTIDDTGINEGAAVALESGKNIIRKGPGWVEVLPMAVRHSQAITVDGVRVIPVRTALSVSRQSSRLMLWIKEDTRWTPDPN